MLQIKKNRIFYLSVTLIIIVLGIASRKINGIPLFIGDILYAVMIYFGLRTLFLAQFKLTLIVAILICFTIEFSQIINWEWLINIRKTTIGHYVLGESFLWSDLGYYIIGCLSAFTFDKSIK